MIQLRIQHTPFYPINPDGINIIMNNSLFSFFIGFSNQRFNGGINGDTDLTYKLQLNINPSNNIIIPAFYGANTSFNMIIVKQDYPSLFSWQQLSKILVKSSSLLLEKDYIVAKNLNNLISVEIIADFEIPQSTREQRDDILYQPQGNLKYLNFKNSGELQKLDIRVIAQYKDLTIHPILLPPGFFISLKLKFKRRIAFNLLQHDDVNNTNNENIKK